MVHKVYDWYWVVLFALTRHVAALRLRGYVKTRRVHYGGMVDRACLVCSDLSLWHTPATIPHKLPTLPDGAVYAWRKGQIIRQSLIPPWLLFYIAQEERLCRT